MKIRGPFTVSQSLILNCTGGPPMQVSSGQEVTNLNAERLQGQTSDYYKTVEIGVAVSDETTALTTGEGKVVFRSPEAFTLKSVRANVNTAPSGSAITVDLKKGGISILSPRLIINDGQKTSLTATQPGGLPIAVSDDEEFSVGLDTVGSSVAGAGLKIWLKGTKA